jgi:uncharacterized protein
MVSRKIILGTAQLGMPYGIAGGKLKTKEEVFSILKTAKAKGVKDLDTANVYGNAEKIIGEFNERYGCQFNINTKFKGHENSIEDQVLKSLEKLKIDALNTCFFHSFEEFMMDSTFLKSLEKLKKEKMIQSIGLSVYTNEQFEIALNAPVDVIQIPFNVLDNWLERGALIRLANKKNKKIQIRSIFLQGLFFLENLPQKLEKLKIPLKEVMALSKKWNIPVAQLLIGYANSFNAIDSVLIGVDSVKHLTQNISFFAQPLPQKLINEIHQIKIKARELLLPINW